MVDACRHLRPRVDWAARRCERGPSGPNQPNSSSGDEQMERHSLRAGRTACAAVWTAVCALGVGLNGLAGVRDRLPAEGWTPLGFSGLERWT